MLAFVKVNACVFPPQLAFNLTKLRLPLQVSFFRCAQNKQKKCDFYCLSLLLKHFSNILHFFNLANRNSYYLKNGFIIVVDIQV